LKADTVQLKRNSQNYPNHFDNFCDYSTIRTIIFGLLGHIHNSTRSKISDFWWSWLYT